MAPRAGSPRRKRSRSSPSPASPAGPEGAAGTAWHRRKASRTLACMSATRSRAASKAAMASSSPA
eukprot:5888473-Lingulodinium_polyedra.AAC.1